MWFMRARPNFFLRRFWCEEVAFLIAAVSNETTFARGYFVNQTAADWEDTVALAKPTWQIARTEVPSAGAVWETQNSSLDPLPAVKLFVSLECSSISVNVVSNRGGIPPEGHWLH